jgi:hypothetical protein
VNKRDDEKRRFVRRVSDKVIADNLKPQGLRGEVRSRVSLMWKGHKVSDSPEDLLAKPRGGRQIVLGYELPDFGDVLRCTRVKLKSLMFSHFGVLFRGARLGELALSAAQIFKESLTVDGFDATALDVIVAAIKNAAQFRYFGQICSHGVFDKFVGSTAALGRQFV